MTSRNGVSEQSRARRPLTRTNAVSKAQRATVLPAFALGLLVAASIASSEGADLSVTAGETDILIARLPAEGCVRLIWLPSMYDKEDLELDYLSRLADIGIEVWWADFVDARFLPRSYRSYDRVPPNDLVAVIDAAMAPPNKRVAVMASGRGALLALTGAQRWARRNPDGDRFLGMLAMHPNFYAYPPQPGDLPAFHHALDEVPLRVRLIEPEYSPRYLWLDLTIEQLREAGADVDVRYLRRVRAGFHYRADPTPEELNMQTAFPTILRKALDEMAGSLCAE